MIRTALLRAIDAIRARTAFLMNLPWCGSWTRSKKCNLARLRIEAVSAE